MYIRVHMHIIYVYIYMYVYVATMNEKNATANLKEHKGMWGVWR